MNSLILSGAISKSMLAIKEWFTPSYFNEVETYLQGSVDLIDLERRMKLLQKRGFI